ncbi:hypothetical protein ACIGXM_05970 [Kitasatospora sp. NPDC052896]|uniref:hypothetical protein n=1 Tax=Kitasatospora sp. NPDC052896 TaxID=3364061 RepID=UPI0037C68855
MSDDWQRSLFGDLGGAAAPAPVPAAVPMDGPMDGPMDRPAHGPAAPAQAVPPAARFAPRLAKVEPPSPVPTLDPALGLVRGKPRSGDSAAVRTGRALRRLLSSSAAQEVERAARFAREIQQPVTTGRQIAVTSIRGGAGKTTVAALLGATFTHYRRDPVLLMEAEPALGSLPIRAGAQELRWTFDDLAQLITPSMPFDQVLGYLTKLPEGGWLLPGSRGQIGARLDLATFQQVAVALRRYFAITVLDCGSLPGELARSALSAAQARVLVAPASVEGVTSTHTVLSWMSGLPRPLLPTTVVVLAETTPHPRLDLAAASAHLRVEGAEVIGLPYDRHLAAGGRIDTARLALGTRERTSRLAAELLNRAVRG